MLRRYDWLWIGAVALYVDISLSKTFIANWYYVPIMLLATVSLAEAVEFFLKNATLTRMVKGGLLSGSAVLLVALYLLIATSEFNPHKNDTIYESLHASEWIRDHMSEKEIGASWNAGVLSYFSGRQI